MKSTISLILTAAVVLLGSGPTFAADNLANGPKQAASKTETVTKKAASKSQATGDPMAVGNTSLVDINSASREALKKLPGIGDAQAAKIIAGRPYGSKAWLISRNILPADKYNQISKAIYAKQPYADGTRNAELYKNKK